MTRYEMIELLEDHGIRCPVDWSGVLGYMTRCGFDLMLAAEVPLVCARLPQSEGVTRLPAAWALAYLQRESPDARILDDTFNGAIVGVLSLCGSAPVLVYDRALCIEVIQFGFIDGHTSDGWDLAVEHFQYNVGDSGMGAGTPAFLVTWDGGQNAR